MKKKIRLWVDDCRPMPPGFTHRVATAKAAIELLSQGNVEYISLDHDLGPENAGSGYEIACFIEKGAATGSLPPLEATIHSQNPVGINKMRIALANAKRYFSTRTP